MRPSRKRSPWYGYRTERAARIVNRISTALDTAQSDSPGVGSIALAALMEDVELALMGDEI